MHIVFLFLTAAAVHFPLMYQTNCQHCHVVLDDTTLPLCILD